MKILINESWKKFQAGRIYTCLFQAALADCGLVFEAENVSFELIDRLKLALAQFLAGHAGKEPLRDALKELLEVSDRENAIVKLLETRADAAIKLRENL